MVTIFQDGTFHFWDKDSKQRLHRFQKVSQPVSAGCFNMDGSIYAYACSYDWSKVRVTTKQRAVLSFLSFFLSFFFFFKLFIHVFFFCFLHFVFHFVCDNRVLSIIIHLRQRTTSCFMPQLNRRSKTVEEHKNTHTHTCAPHKLFQEPTNQPTKQTNKAQTHTAATTSTSHHITFSFFLSLSICLLVCVCGHKTHTPLLLPPHIHFNNTHTHTHILSDNRRGQKIKSKEREKRVNMNECLNLHTHTHKVVLL